MGAIKISMGSWAFSFGPYAENPLPLDVIARRLAEAGYDGIELGGFPPHVTLEAYSTPDSRRALRNLLSDLNLGVSGYAADIGGANMTAEENRQRYIDLFRRQLELCVDLGSPALRVDTVAAPGSIPDSEYQAALFRVADVWRDCAAYAQQAGVRMVWEFEPGFIFNKPSEVVTMHDRVGHPSFQILLDTCHAYMCSVVGARQHGRMQVLEGGVEALLKLLEGRIGAIHIVDSDGTLHSDDTSTHVPFGDGMIPWDRVAPMLRDIPGIHWWCVDLCFWPGSWDLIPASHDFVRRLALPS